VLPARIEALEGELQGLNGECHGPDFYQKSREHIASVLERLRQAEQERDAAMERWLALEERDAGGS
jgi:ATP-binding cassette subfamily F protein uup